MKHLHEQVSHQGIQGTFLQPIRFGRALARLRTEHAAAVKRNARDVIKHNLKTYRSIPRNTRADARWIKCAELGPVLDFLS